MLYPSVIVALMLCIITFILYHFLFSPSLFLPPLLLSSFLPSLLSPLPPFLSSPRFLNFPLHSSLYHLLCSNNSLRSPMFKGTVVVISAQISCTLSQPRFYYLSVRYIREATDTLSGSHYVSSYERRTISHFIHLSILPSLSLSFLPPSSLPLPHSIPLSQGV